MKRALCALVAVLVLAVPALCMGEGPENELDRFRYNRKDPILAGALSWYVPGLGQMYSGAVLKGALFFAVEESLHVATILTLTEIKLDVTGNVGLGINIKSRSNPDRDDQRNAIIFGVSLAVIHFINVIDAVNTSRTYNRRQEAYLSAGLERGERGDVASLAVNTRF